MDRDEAALAMRLRAYVKVRPQDGRSTWSHGKITEVNGRNATIRNGKHLQDFPIERIQLDDVENRRNGIAIDHGAQDAGEPHVIYDASRVSGWSGETWVEDELRWRRYPTRHAAKDDADRFAHNGIKGLDVMRLSAAVDRHWGEVERKTTPQSPTASDPVQHQQDQKAFGQLSSINLNMGTFSSFAKACAETEAESRQNEQSILSDQELINEHKRAKANRARMDAESDRFIESAQNRINARIAKRPTFEAELAGNKAKLIAMLSQ